MATSPLLRPNAHSTGSSDGAWSTKRIATCALLVALSLVASFIELPIFPPAPWLKYDPSGVVCLVAGMAFGAGTGVLVSVLSWIPHLLMDPLGGLMGILCTVALTTPASVIYARRHTRVGAIAGMAAGAILTLFAAIALNLVITPLYAGVTTQQVLAMVVPILAPFNLIKALINCVVTRIVYKPVSTLIGE